MRRLKLPIAIFLSAFAGLTQVQANSFTSIHSFGDSVSTTTASPAPSQYFYGGRFCNGRVWIEVLAAWQGITYVSAQNSSAFGNDIENVETELLTYTAPGDVGTALYILWVSGADFANFMFAGDGLPYQASNLSTWNTFIDDTLDTHEAVITELYNKGVRNLILPNQPDLSVAPVFGLTTSELSFIKARVQDFNSDMETRLAVLLPTLPGLKVWTPDVFQQFEDILAAPAAFNLQNPDDGFGFFDFGLNAAFGAGGTPDLAAGPGVDYVFWDDLNPTAAVQFILADLVQDEVCPPKADSISIVTGGFDLQFSNLPIGRPARIEGSSNLTAWVEDLSLTPTATSDTYTLNTSGTERFFRLNVDSGWVWP